MTTTITDSIKYIGVDDTDLDLFESQYFIPNGISYNSYLIIDEKIAIMDTADQRKCQEWLKNLRVQSRGRTPDYLIVLHLEPDHAGCIAALVEQYPTLKIVASNRALKMLPQFFDNVDFSAKTIPMKEGETLSLGQHTLQFFMAPMVLWPEVMVAYDKTDKVLFSADGFGKFGALSHDEEWDNEARRYYFNICGKYGTSVQSLLKKIYPLKIDYICPLHGPILHDNIDHYISLYDTWSRYKPETEGIFIAYASIHGGTATVAHRLKKILIAKGSTKVFIADLSRDDMAWAVESAFRMDRLVVASASDDADVFPPMHDFLHHLQLTLYQNRRVGIIENGSWAPSAARTMRSMLEQMKNIEIVEPIVTIYSRMKHSDIPHLEALADALLS